LLVPQGSEQGYWDVTNVTAIDTSGNSVQYTSSELASLRYSNYVRNALLITCSAATLSTHEIANGALWVTFVLLGVAWRRRRRTSIPIS
jgi:hypothetical protein